MPNQIGARPSRNSGYVQDLCNELDNNSREISFRMTANGGPTREEAREVKAYIVRQRAILSILEARAEKERMK
jgi:hypothetical protein